MPQYLPSGNKRIQAAGAARGPGRPAYEAAYDEPVLAPLDLRQIITTLRKRVWLVLATTLAAGAIAVWYAFNVSPVYRATGTVRLTDTRQQLTGGLVDPAASATGVRETTDPVMTEIAVFTSRAMIGKVVDSLPRLRVATTGFSPLFIRGFTLDTASWRDPSAWGTIALAFGAQGVTATGPKGEQAEAPYGVALSVDGTRFAINSRPKAKEGKLKVLRREDAVDALVPNVTAKPRENTSIIDVSFESTDPTLARKFVDALIATYQQYSVDISSQQARRRRLFVESQLRQNDSLLTQARLALSDFRSHEKAYSARDKFSAQARDLDQVQTQIDDLTAQATMYNSVLQAMAQGKGKESLQKLGALLSAQGASASPIVTDQYMQMVHLQNTRDSLVTDGKAVTNPDVQRIDVLMSTASDRLKMTLQPIVETLRARIATMQGVRTRSTQVLTSIPASDADEASLTERELSFQKVADQLRDELQRARLAEAAEVGSVEVVDESTMPRVPIGSRARQKILLGVLLGLFFGSGCALVLEHLDQSIHGRDDIEASLQLPGLAVIPRIDNAALAKRVRKVLTNGSNGASNGASRQVSDKLVTINDSRSVGAEAYRTLRTKLLFSRALSSLKTIVVTSPFAQDGKSTVAANLATTFAQHGMRTLLIDCDLRRPTQHEVFRVSSRPGLTDLLMTDEMIPGAGRRTSVENLSLITAGALPPDPPELVGSARMRALLEKLGETFDVIVLDTPPVLPVADSAILASLADGVLLVVRAGQTDRRAAQLAVQQLQDVDARILGAVLNDPNEQVPLYDQYGYATYYGYAAKE